MFFQQVFVSDNKDTSSRDVDNFFNFADMQMGLWIISMLKTNCFRQTLDIDFLHPLPLARVKCE